VPTSLFHTFRALRFRNFRLLWISLFVSFAGSFMQQAAILWHVSLLVAPDHKGLALGMVGLVRVVPIILFSLISGVAADVFDRRKLMLVTQIGGTLVASTLAFLAFMGLAVAWPIYVLAAIGAATSAFDAPARQALLPMLVSREDLPNAISLNTVMVQIAQVGGPAIGGVVIALTSVAWAYVFNAISFLVVVVALLMMRDVPATERGASHAGDEMSLKAAIHGLRFVFRAPMIRSTMLLDFFATFFASATALLPIFAQDILHVGPRGYGWLYAAPAVGASLGSLAMLRAIDAIDRRGPVLVWAVVAYGVATVVFGFSSVFWISFLCLALSGASDAVSMVIRNLVRQLDTPDELRGRMTGINMVFFMGGPQLGELEAGTVANWLGAPFSVVSGGFGCLIATAVVVFVTPQLWHYRRVPHVALTSAAQKGPA
jgi:MFS family permease